MSLVEIMSDFLNYLIGKSHVSTSIKSLSNDKKKGVELSEVMLLVDTVYENISDDERLFIISNFNILLDYSPSCNYNEYEIMTFINKIESCVSTVKSIDNKSYLDTLEYALLYTYVLLHFR